jgi:uncharacterized SAM-binding protein YcdF (DUF218 family)
VIAARIETETFMPLIGHGLRKLGRVLFVALAILGLTMLIVTTTPLVTFWSRALAGPWKDPRGEILVVLGGDSPEEGMLGRSTYLRAQYAVRAYGEGTFHTIVLCGGGPPETVAHSMEQFLLFSGIPRTAILTEEKSLSTRENAVFVKPLLATLHGRKVLMTSDFHMHRATLVFRKAGIEVEPRPIPDGLKRVSQWGSRWTVFQDCVMETAKMLYYRLRGWA